MRVFNGLVTGDWNDGAWGGVDSVLRGDIRSASGGGEEPRGVVS